MSYRLPFHLVNRPVEIVVVGAGGTGSALLTELFQMSYLLEKVSQGQVRLNVTVYDDDAVSYANIGRQNFFPCDVGLNKATVLVSRFNAYGNTKWEAKEKRFLPHMLKHQTDIIITCTDSAQFRGALGRHFESEKGTWLWIDTGNCSSTGQVIMGHLGSDNKTLLNVYDYYPQLCEMQDNNTDSCSHEEALAKQDYGVNKQVAISAASLLWQLLRHGKVDSQGCLIDVRKGSVDPILLTAYEPAQ